MDEEFMCPVVVRPAEEIRRTFKPQPDAPMGAIELSGPRPPYMTLYCGEDENDRDKDVVAVIIYRNKKASKVRVDPKSAFFTTREHWLAFRATMDQHFDFPRSPHLKSKKKPKPQRSSRKKR